MKRCAFFWLIIFWHYQGGSFAQNQVSLIIYNANIITLDDSQPSARAIAVASDRIADVGTNERILAYRNPSTWVIDAKGRTIIPGLYDSHLHVIRAGRYYNSELRWDGVKTLKRALQMLKEQAARTPDGQWVRVVGGWNEHQFAEKRLPTLQEINDATGKTPAFILYLYGKAYLNKAGLSKLNINADTPNPARGLIEKDVNGEPTGLLIADPGAFILYSTLAKLPELSGEEKINSTRLYIAELNRLGITSVMDAGGGFQNYPEDYIVTDVLSQRGELNVRLPYYLFAQNPGKEFQDYQKWIQLLEDKQHKGDSLSVEYFVRGAGENLVSSAGDFENFLQPRPDLSVVMEKELKQVISILVQHRWPFRLHATYNESITRFLDVIEAVNQEFPLKDLPWIIDHAETISEMNIRRIKVLNGGISVQHRMAYNGENFVARYGMQAARNTPPIKRMIELGVKVGAGTDGTRVASYNPWVSLYWLVSGKTIGGNSYMSGDNLPDRLTALKLYTQGSASLINEDKNKGTLKKGYLADFVLLTADFLTTPTENIRTIQSVLTVLGGKVVFGSGEYKTLAPTSEKAIPAWSPVNFYGGYQND